MAKTDFIFPAFSSRFLNFAVNSAFAVGFHSTRSNARVGFDSGVIFLDQSQFLRTVTNEVASFCIDNRLRQMAFFRLHQRGQRRGKDRLSRYVEIF